MALFIDPPVTTPRVHRIAFGWDSVFAILNLNVVQNLFCTVSPISKHIATRNVHVRQDIYRNRAIMDISGRKLKINRIAQTVHDSMNLGCLPAPACANMLIELTVYCPFLAPTLC